MSGLSTAVKIVGDIEGIAVHRFTDRDVVRHHLVQKIIVAYDRYEKEAARRHAEHSDEKQKFRYKKYGDTKQ